MHPFILAILLGFVADGPPTARHVQQPAGKAVWDAHCKKCHGVKGAPAASMKRMMPKLPVLDSTFVSTFSVKAMATVIDKGVGDMKPLGAKLTPEEIAAVSSYVFELTHAKPTGAKSGK